jgi:hypothetical protein
MEIQTPFRANYEMENPPELPSSGAGVLYFPPVRSDEGRIYEERLKLTYLGQRPWYGVFAAQFREGLRVASTMPNPDWCCISSAGTGYVLNVARPQEWQPVPILPLLRVTVVSKPQLLLLNSFDRIVAYSEEGQRWRSESLCDELKVVAVKGDAIECTGWDAPTGEDIRLRIDLASGKRKR